MTRLKVAGRSPHVCNLFLGYKIRGRRQLEMDGGSIKGYNSRACQERRRHLVPHHPTTGRTEEPRILWSQIRV